MLGPKRKLHVYDGTSRHAVSGPDVSWANWQEEVQDGYYAWPSWSHDARRIAAFHLPDTTGRNASIRLIDVDGIRDIETETLGQKMPIYLAWSPDGTQLAFVTQTGDQLDLHALDTSGQAAIRHLVGGSPLFFNWADDQLAAYIGAPDPEHSTLQVFDPTGGQPARTMPHTPRNFCTPLWQRPDLIYVAHFNGRNAILRTSVSHQVVRILAFTEGLVAMVDMPELDRICIATAPGGDDAPYSRLAVLDAHSGEELLVHEDELLAYYWAPGAGCIVIAQVDNAANTIQWWRLDLDGETTLLATHRPTREVAFSLRFFEQYHITHPFVDPEGHHLVLTGSLMDGGVASDNLPRVWRIPLDGQPAEELTTGVFAVYPPPLGTTPEPG